MFVQIYKGNGACKEPRLRFIHRGEILYDVQISDVLLSGREEGGISWHNYLMLFDGEQIDFIDVMVKLDKLP